MFKKETIIEVIKNGPSVRILVKEVDHSVPKCWVTVDSQSDIGVYCFGTQLVATKELTQKEFDKLIGGKDESV